jgi:hypothetical protein
MDKKKLIGHFSSALAGLVFTGIVGTAAGETFGYSHGAVALFCLFGYQKVADFFSSKVK